MEFLIPGGSFRDQIVLLQNEEEQLRASLPMVTAPFKRSRQSQMEVDRSYLEATKRNLIYKLTYLKDGVSEHLKRMFEIAIELGKISKPPEGFELSDVEPSLASILLKDYNKQKTQTYAQALNLSQGFIAPNPELMDNVDGDKILRNNFDYLGVPDGLRSLEGRTQIRKDRAEERNRQEQINLAMMQAEMQLTGAKSMQAAGSGAKTLSEAAGQTSG